MLVSKPFTIAQVLQKISHELTEKQGVNPTDLVSAFSERIELKQIFLSVILAGAG